MKGDDFRGEGELVPVVRFPEFRGAGSWRVVRMGDIVHPVTDWVEGNELDSYRLVPGVGFKRLHSFMFGFGGHEFRIKKNDFAYTKVAAKGYQHGYLARYKGSEDVAVLSEHCSFYRAKEGLVNPVFLDYLFKSPSYASQLTHHLRHPHIFCGDCGGYCSSWPEFLIVLPPESVSEREQRKIANFFVLIEKLIEAESKKIEILKKHNLEIGKRHLFEIDERVRAVDYASFLSDFEQKIHAHKERAIYLKEMREGFLQSLFPKMDAIRE